MGMHARVVLVHISGGSSSSIDSSDKPNITCLYCRYLDKLRIFIYGIQSNNFALATKRRSTSEPYRIIIRGPQPSAKVD